MGSSKLIRDYMSVVVGTGVSKAISYCIFIILAHSLGISGFGFFSLFFTIMILIWQFPNVIDVTYVRYVLAEDLLDKLSCLRVAFFIKISIFTFILIMAYPLAYFLAFNVFHKPDSLLCISSAIISGAFLSLFTTLTAVYQGEGNFLKFSVSNTAFYASVIAIISIILLLKIKLSLSIVIGTNTLVAIFVGIFGILQLFKKIKKLFPVNMKLLFDMFHFGKWLLAANLTFIIFQRLDILVLAKYVDYDTLGIYSAAVRVAMLASIFTTSVSAIFIPRGSQALNSLQQLKSYLRESLIASTALAFFVVLLAIFSPTIIKVLLGERYLKSLPYARLLLLEPIFTLLYTPFMYLFYAENNSLTVFILGLTIFVATICSLFFLVPAYGLTGAAISIPFAAFCGLLFVFLRTLPIIKKKYGYI